MERGVPVCRASSYLSWRRALTWSRSPASSAGRSGVGGGGGGEKRRVSVRRAQILRVGATGDGGAQTDPETFRPRSARAQPGPSGLLRAAPAAPVRLLLLLKGWGEGGEGGMSATVAPAGRKRGVCMCMCMCMCMCVCACAPFGRVKSSAESETTAVQSRREWRAKETLL